jgi:gliding motility-associated lipoprotein GldB
MKHNPILIIPLIALHLTGLNSCDTIRGKHATAAPVHIHRFDKDVYQLILMDTPELQQQIATRYPSMLKVIGRSIFQMQDTQTPAAFFDRLVNYYAEPTLHKLYRDALKQYESVESAEAELGEGFRYLQSQLPEMQLPAVYMHVSGLQQNVIVADSLLSISIDKYLGADYPLYQDYFYDYQRHSMEPACIVPDYLTAWLLSEYPFKGNDRVLLERMIYEGKIKYILHQALPGLAPETGMKYTAEAYRWCRQNERWLWHLLIERKHLYTPDIVATSRYFSDRPSTFIADRAPGNIGTWIGWQIVTGYMNRTNASIRELMMNTDYQDILTKSKYKP